MRVGVADLPEKRGGRGEERDLLPGVEVGSCEGGEDKGNKRDVPQREKDREAVGPG
jgi:hypothetical protein